MKWLRLFLPRELWCLFRGHDWTTAALVGVSGAAVRWCPSCNRVEWID